MTLEELVERDTRAQGLPLQLGDPNTLACVAAIVSQRKVLSNGERPASTGRRAEIREEADRAQPTASVRS